MNNKQFPYLTILASIITIAIIAIQVYWNWKNYEDTKKRLFTDTQITVDNTVDKYFIDVSRKKLENLFPNTFSQAVQMKHDTITTFESSKKRNIQAYNKIEGLIPQEVKDARRKAKRKIVISNIHQSEEYKATTPKGVSIQIHNTPDVVINKTTEQQPRIERFEVKKENMAQPYIIQPEEGQSISLFGDSINYKTLIFNLNKSLLKKGLSTDFDLVHTKLKEVVYVYNNVTKKEITKKYIPARKYDYILVKSNYLFYNQEVKLYFKNLPLIAFKKTLNSILLSLALSIGMIWCMFFLIQTINKQKQIAEMKNDFIGNISHELKTPIAIVASAIEGIQNFNTTNNKEKTEKYLKISSVELQKLNTIVEKILETASREGKEIELKKETVDLSKLLENCIQMHQLKTNKILLFRTDKTPIFITLDEFHFENSINNLIENAIKYGGNCIEILVNQTEKNCSIEVKDNGDGISKQFQEKIFEKFYRIPTQNIHNVKGFGIGLYYVKQLIEKHDGTIKVTSNQNGISFKITLPNDNKNQSFISRR